ncbi:GDP-mannose-dependent alpha-(1-6)-phosphatidylinositol monomannoside mannosyltransferase [Paraglaciecola mesophila]|uniref:GDP-mannose-dependent alpha-(1-6)-phosphatidylinositol monomannoside mannosyltransferase n=1 Tax=Paraglaciecola mesophila TaxID=197222 RepID=A0A857JJ05_9ALTE|nr:glycosyltransferase family 4 protein [Paraglaciecola mesophila]QHJ11282.1 GDP-mannose-dependent alpha-(1-6)-phosphatidylinositol monomannoside mannosyltransferase [Paraglaciecola mesophila]
MKKTLLLSEIFPPVKGGSGRWFWEVYTRIAQDNVVVAAGQDAKSDEVDATSPLKTYRLPLSSWSWGLKSLTGLKYYFRVLRNVIKVAKQNDIQVIHCGRCLPEGFIGFMISKIKGIPYICYVHGEDVETAATSRELSWIVNKALSGATRLIANSQNTADILLNNWHTEPAKTMVFNPGVDASLFIPAPFSQEVKSRLGWEDKKVILTVGRLQERKGHDKLIEALPDIITRVPNALYAIIGDGERKAALHALVQDLKLEAHVVFMSELDDEQMIQCYQQCDLFVLPNRTVGSDIEGFGMVLVEAQACERPVIAGDSGGTAETMIVGETGFIVDCTQPRALASKICDLLENDELRERMGKAGRKHVQQTLDWPVLSQALKEEFDSL